MDKEQYLPVVHYRANRIPDDRPGAGIRAARRFWDVRMDVVDLCRKFGPVGPDDGETGYDYEDFVFWVVEDQYNEERYQYVEFCGPQGITEDWLLELTSLLKRKWPQWGVGARIPQGYLMVFQDRLMVTGTTLRRCTTIHQVVAQLRKALTFDAMIRGSHSDADLEQLSQVSGIEKLPLELRDLKKVTDAGLAFLARMRGVRCLNLDGSRVTNQGLIQLNRLPKLESLYLQKTKIGDARLIHLRELPRLKSLHLFGCQVTDAGLCHLAGLKTLEELGLGRTKTTDDGVMYLRALTRLRQLSLDRCRITDRGLSSLVKLTRLERLDLPNTKVTDAGLIPLRRLRRLESLDLNETKVTPAGVEAFRQAMPDCQVMYDKA